MISAARKYQIIVKTGDKIKAGTDANVFIDLHGINGRKTGKIFLKNSESHKNKFEQNQSDEFLIEDLNVGELEKIK